MASILVIGESGTGKTASLRNLNPDKLLLIQNVKKPLPFKNDWKPWDSKSKTGTILYTSDWRTIIAAIENAHKYGKEIIVIDDFQYMMSFEFMDRGLEKGFDKFTEIGLHAFKVIMASTKSDINVYILSHSNSSDDGITRMKTIGKLLDEKITPEGLFTIVLKTVAIKGDYFFTTVNQSDTVKAPMGMFGNEEVENDLNIVNDVIDNYYQK